MVCMEVLTNSFDKISFESQKKRVKIVVPDLFVYMTNRRLEQFEKK
jgi:hypothetical protein